MKTFKKFLIENANARMKTADLPVFRLTFIADKAMVLNSREHDESDEINEREIEQELEDSLKTFVSGASVSQVEVYDGGKIVDLIFVIWLTNPHDAERISKGEIVKPIREILTQAFPGAAPARFSIVQSDMSVIYPVPFLVNFKEIELVINHQTGLSNIHEMIDCQTLRMDGARKVTRSVLALLRIPSLKSLYADDRSGWVKIVSEHLKGEKDILACQEELINRGLKEYARL
jgi:hypothetical protein